MKTLCLIITGLSTGGAETMLLKLLQNMDRGRFAPQVISLTTKGDIGPRIEALGIPVHALGMKPGMPSPVKFLRLIDLLRDSQPEIIHTWMYHADLVGALVARLVGIRRVAWGIRHSNLSPHHNKRSTLMVMKLCALTSGWLPCRILSCSERARMVHIDAGYRADKMVLIPNGFDMARFQPDPSARCAVRVELGLPPDTPLVGLIAREDPQKNHTGFVEAAALVHKRLPKVHFVLAGTGMDQYNLELNQLINQTGLQSQFHLLGRREDIPRLMAAIDVLASSSFGEAFPNVLGEAMASGVPCVVTDVGDSAEIVGDTGRVVASGDMTGLARHLVELLALSQDERTLLGVRARERVRERYEIGSVVRLYEDFYMRLLGEH
jgi:glycosyltransferase involved in cell wall biosynthesis